MFFSKNNNPYSEKSFKAIWEIQKVILETINFDEATHKIVNIILDQLGYLKYGYHVIVLTLLDNEKNCLKRVAISRTETAEKFLKESPVPFQDIIIPLSASENILVKAINEKQIQLTSNVSDVLSPGLPKDWVDNFQKFLGIKTSIVFPISVRNKMLGTLIFSLIKERTKITKDEWTILKTYTSAVGIALDNALLFKSLTDTTEKLRITNERLKEIDKLKDEFVSLASHELRTPMTIIKSYIFMLLNKPDGTLSEKQKTYLERTSATIERLIKLVNDMLNVSRIESGKINIERSQTDLGKLISDVVSEMQTKAVEAGIHLVYKNPQSPLLANIDANRIKEVIINLIGNSLKFTPNDGSITVSADEQNNNSVLIKVVDTGRGIRTEDMKKLFQKFSIGSHGYLTKDKGQGTGLGLYLSKSLVEMHGGKIWAESQGEGKGTTFSIILPLNTNNSGASKTIGEAAYSSDQTNTNLLPAPSQPA